MLVRAMKIRYKIGLSIGIIACAVFIFGTSVLIGLSVNTVTGGIVLIAGIAYLVRPLAELSETELTVFALVGPLKRRYPVAELRVVNGRICSADKKVPLPAWSTNGDDYRTVIQRVNARGAG
jgi:hypothetical protein